LLLQAGDLAALRMDEQEPDGEPEHEHARDDDPNQRVLRERLRVLHEPLPPDGAARSAAMLKSTTGCLPTIVLVELISWTFVRSGTSWRRDSRRATPSCEYVRPWMMSIDGTVLPPVLDEFVAGEIGDFALSDVSQTSPGRMSENSRKTRSQETRLER